MLIAFASVASSKAEVELAVSEGQKVKKAKKVKSLYMNSSVMAVAYLPN